MSRFDRLVRRTPLWVFPIVGGICGSLAFGVVMLAVKWIFGL
ncbi:hypothetical protein [Sinomonas sp. ASV322]|nr:hypothetical protein [Sinomonas sp. ASV322]MDQ4502156.1 hypothetical protein [Sinomonas sp. ASV322]